MMWTRVLLFSAVVLLLLGCVAAKNKHDTNPNVKFGFVKATGGSKRALGLPRLERIRRKAGFEGRPEELANTIDTDDDLGVDLVNDELIYACSGMAYEPLVTSAVTETAAAGEVDGAVASGEPSMEPSSTELPESGHAHHHHHHHHHHRRLQQTGVEFANPWLPGNPDTPITKEQAFTLHSRPSAVRKIHLDFDGHVTSGASWNNAYNGGLPFTTPPFDTDNNGTNWSASELATILAVWRAVSEDFSAYDVDVTTEEPVGAPLSTWTRAAIGGHHTDWFKSSAGGVAYVNVFGRNDHFYQPAFVFTKALSDSAKNIWEATSHEIGHNMGLNHDGVSVNGTLTAGYYTGHADWAPIMGVGYSKGLTQWSKGEYPDASNKEDDFAKIALKVPFISQLHGNSMATAYAMGGVQDASGLTATAKIPGIIRSPEDLEYMSFVATNAGTANFRVLAMPIYGTRARSNLNATLTVRNSAGVVMVSKSNVGISAFDLPLPAAGTYYVSLSGTGAGNATGTTGYSSYGSRGQYELVVTYPYVTATPSPSPAPLPSPSPSPSPPPAPKYMTISSFVGSRTVTNNRWTCVFTLTIVDSSTRAALGGVRLTGQWSSVRSINFWPYAAQAVTTSAAGTATITATRTLAASTGNGCTLTISSLTLASYQWDPTSVKSNTIRW